MRTQSEKWVSMCVVMVCCALGSFSFNVHSVWGCLFLVYLLSPLLQVHSEHRCEGFNIVSPFFWRSGGGGKKRVLVQKQN